jgi:hypothetical protein
VNDAQDSFDDLTERLHALGQPPVDPALQSQHLTAMAGTDWKRSASFASSFASRIKLGAALVAGFLLGATGLATAGALGPLQPIAATAVEAATPLNVPKGANANAEKDRAKAEKADKVAKAAGASAAKTSPDGFHGTARFTNGCVKAANGEFAIDRGQYLKQERAKGPAALAAAKASDCGKPLRADGTVDPAATDDAADQEAEHDPANDANKKTATTEPACVGNAASAAASGKPECATTGNGTTDTDAQHGRPADKPAKDNATHGKSASKGMGSTADAAPRAGS